MLLRTKRLVMIAILSALSFLLLFLSFPLLPAASFLRVDLSIIPMLVALVLYDLRTSMWVLVIRSLLKLFLDNKGVETYIGLPMNMIALGIFLVSFALIWKGKKNLFRYALASAIGTASLSFAMVCLNFLYAIPLYARFAHFDIGKIIGIHYYLFNMVMPFNLLQGFILSVTFYLVYVSCASLLERYKESGKGETKI